MPSTVDEITDQTAPKREADSEALTPPDVTVVIPAFNEEGAVRDEVEALHRVMTALGRPFEILVVDDGSTDDTASEAAKAPCRVLRQPENRGYGAALKRGIRAARSERVIITDADGTYPAEEIPRLLERADHEMVVGARIGANVHAPLVRRPAKFCLRMLASFLAGRLIPDLNSGLRVLRRSVIARFAHILPDGFSFTTTITLAMLCNGHSVAYAPIDYHRRIGKSKIRPSHAYHFLILILRVIVLFNPLKVFLPLGGLLFLAGVAKVVHDIVVGNLSESAVMAILGAIIIWALGLLADQSARLGMGRESWDRVGGTSDGLDDGS